jgi:hypothetical protein
MALTDKQRRYLFANGILGKDKSGKIMIKDKKKFEIFKASQRGQRRGRALRGKISGASPDKGSVKRGIVKLAAQLGVTAAGLTAQVMLLRKRRLKSVMGVGLVGSAAAGLLGESGARDIAKARVGQAGGDPKKNRISRAILKHPVLSGYVFGNLPGAVRGSLRRKKQNGSTSSSKVSVGSEKAKGHLAVLQTWKKKKGTAEANKQLKRLGYKSWSDLRKKAGQ